MNFSAFSFLCAIFFSVTFASCEKPDRSPTPAMEFDIDNISYGMDTANNMDIYLPPGRDTANTKVILFIHGGSWSSGNKNEFAEAIPAIRSKLDDYAIFNIDYRFAFNDSTRFPAQIDDIESAIKFIQSKAGEYRINANKICLVGASAGAHLALLTAYRNNKSGKIKAVVDLFGPTDLTDLYQNHPLPAQARPVLVNFLGATPATNPGVYINASPINFINAQTVPTKIFHGTEDIVVPIAQSNTLKTKLEEFNVKVDMTVYPGEGHGWSGNNLLDTYQKTVDFIRENVH
ncbi:alpha/beta hydrolase [Segetibacter koreensis]|uniref:alpha/beta hydrolase n=1 Tax=Segetibacter koreensis TaxID=398037 RepID=UPI00035C2CCB|nr:alpha/beta hydrolase [Segetibacter koreensis]